MNLFEKNSIKRDVIKISIVMPIHNTPEYALRESLDSILTQEFTCFEVICVDDGSSVKETIETLNEYKIKDNRIQVIRLEKSIGCGGARNVGIKLIRGKYTIFLDSDDYFPPDYLQKLYRLIEKEATDVCVTGFSIFNELGNGKNIKNVKRLNRTYQSYIDSGDLLIECTLSACNKLVRTNFLKEENINFITTETDDDVLYGAMVLLCTKNISILRNYEGFLYRFDTDYQLSSHMNPLDLLTGIKKVKNELIKRNKSSIDSERLLISYLICTGIMEMGFCKNEDNNLTFYNKMMDILKRIDCGILEKRMALYKKKWVSLPYESKWYELIGNYKAQFNYYRDELVIALNSLREPRVIWGLGKRGKALERFAYENNIRIYSVCDQENVDCGKTDEEGNMILNTDDVLKMQNVSIIATNNRISTDLKNIYGIKTFPLEKYCDL